MVHIFLIHSHITYIVSKSIVEYLSLNSNEVIYLTTRNYKSPDPDILTVNLDDEFTICNNISYLNFFQNWSNIERVDNIIDSYVNTEFSIYLPHLSSYLYQILASNKKCVHINIIEEGVSCLSKTLYTENTSFKHKCVDLIFNKLGIFGKFRFYRVASDIDFKYYKKFKSPTLWSISPDAFREAPQTIQKIVVPLRTNNFKINDYKIPEESFILIMEGSLEHKFVTEDTFFNSINVFINKVNVKNLYVKFHPYQTIENKNRLVQILSKKFNMIIIPDYVIMEMVFFENTTYNVYGFTSSLLYYANLFGNKNVVSLINYWNNDELYIKFKSINDYSMESLLSNNSKKI